MKPCPNHPAGRTCPACDPPLSVHLARWLPWLVLGPIAAAGVVVFWPITLLVVAIVTVVRFAAREFARANREP
jgi:hypothetical protein